MSDNKPRARKSLIRITGVALLAAALGIWTGIAAASSGSPSGSETPATRPSIGGWPADSNGDGVISDSGAEQIPELISAVGDNGVSGYVRYSDLEGPQPANPEEAVKMSNQTRAIPVYAADGKTVIDQYTISGDKVNDISPTPAPSPS